MEEILLIEKKLKKSTKITLFIINLVPFFAIVLFLYQFQDQAIFYENKFFYYYTNTLHGILVFGIVSSMLFYMFLKHKMRNIIDREKEEHKKQDLERQGAISSVCMIPFTIPALFVSLAYLTFPLFVEVLTK